MGVVRSFELYACMSCRCGKYKEAQEAYGRPLESIRSMYACRIYNDVSAIALPTMDQDYGV